MGALGHRHIGVTGLHQDGAGSGTWRHPTSTKTSGIVYITQIINLSQRALLDHHEGQLKKSRHVRIRGGESRDVVEKYIRSIYLSKKVYKQYKLVRHHALLEG